MNFAKHSGFFIITLLSIYISIWYGDVIPVLIENDLISYIETGIMLFFLFCFFGIVFIIPSPISKSSKFLVAISNLIFVGISLLCPLFWILLILSLLHGILLGTWMRKIKEDGVFLHTLPYLSLGVALAFTIRYLNFKSNLFKQILIFQELSSILNLLLLPFIIIFIALIFIIVLSQYFYRILPDFDSTIIVKTNNELWYKILSNILVLGFILVEIIFVLWSLILKDNSQGAINEIAFPAVILIIFVLRKYSYDLNICSHLGHLFSLSILLIFSLGLFYTFEFKIFFILGFAVSIAYLSKSLLENSSGLSMKLIAAFSIFTGILMFLISLFIDNYIEFISSINLPKTVWVLSAKQALIKEMSSFAAIISIILGLLYLFRRNFQSA